MPVFTNIWKVFKQFDIKSGGNVERDDSDTLDEVHNSYGQDELEEELPSCLGVLKDCDDEEEVHEDNIGNAGDGDAQEQDPHH